MGVDEYNNTLSIVVYGKLLQVVGVYKGHIAFIKYLNPILVIDLQLVFNLQKWLELFLLYYRKFKEYDGSLRD